MKRIAIVGTGIAGLSCGYFLKNQFDITFYEKNDYPGGHTNTLRIKEGLRDCFIDSGFIVYNEITYPHLTQLFKELEIQTKPTSMSFSVQHVPSGLEFCGTGLNGLFGQRRNLLSPRFYHLLLEMNRFNRDAPRCLDDPAFIEKTVLDFIKEHRFSDDFLNQFLIPMSAAVWSMPTERIFKFPIATLIRFFKNHGFLGLNTHYQWRTVEGGSRQYRDKILSFFKDKVRLNLPIQKIKRTEQGVNVVNSRGETKTFDMVILAAHANQSLQMLDSPTDLEKELLSPFKYQNNHVILHTDSSIMPKTKAVWSSWNYRIICNKQGQLTPTTIYDMNSLQQISKEKNYFLSVNDPDEVNPAQILWQIVYEHPIFDVAAIKAQSRLAELNRQDHKVFFCGSYFGYGFHEDALNSGMAVVSAMTQKKVWE